MNRRNFVRNAALSAAAFSIGSQVSYASSFKTNPLPRWRGFNLLDFFSPYPLNARPATAEAHLKWISEWGFDFVRVPMAYPYYLDIDHNKKISADDVYKINERAVEKIDQLVLTAHKYNLHVSLNLHRAPGYCINAGFHEPFNLWKDEAAQQAFYHHWAMWAKRYRDISPGKISFDLVNEPAMREDMNDQHSPATTVPGQTYRKVAQGALDAIRREKKDALVIADGNDVGNSVIHEIKDLPIAQSCRGYYPHAISHYKAPWANKDLNNLPDPVWPGEINGKHFSRESLRSYYQPWIDLTREGVGVHCGECGCWNKTPHDVFLAWFSDLLDVLKNNHIGFAIWEFVGDFGILNSGRSDVAYEDWHGYKLDRKFLNLLMKS